jgi:hypothetical protein
MYKLNRQSQTAATVPMRNILARCFKKGRTGPHDETFSRRVMRTGNRQPDRLATRCHYTGNQPRASLERIKQHDWDRHLTVAQ